MSTAREQLIMVLDLRASNKAKSRVSERINSGVCLGENCDGSQCNEPIKARGLCSKCHYKWRAVRMRMSETNAAVYDSKLIRLGRLLSPHGAKEYKNKSAFGRLA